MARPKKIGNEKCPYPECGELGRKRQKSVRNRPTGRYVRYYWFRHNDSNIPEHYIDNLVNKEKEKNPGLEIAERYNKMAYWTEKIGKRIMSFPLTKEELIWLNQRLEWHFDNIIIPCDIMADITTGRLKAPPGTKNALRKIILENLHSKYNVLGKGYRYLYVMYDRPMRLERNRVRNAKLSAGNGSTSNEFTGIEPIENKVV